MTAESLLQILPVYLHGSQGPYLLPAEREVWDRACHKEPCRLPEEGPGRLIRADFLVWLLTEERLKGLLPPSGLRIEGGRLVASVAEENPAPAPLIIPHATLHHTLQMEGTEIGGIYGPNAHTRTLRFIQCRFTGPILLQNAILHGELNLSRSTLQLSEREFYSIDLTESEIHGPLILRQMQCHAIYAQSLRVRGSVQASQVRTKGRLFFQAAQIEGDVILVEAQVGGVEVETPEASSGEEGGLSFADLRFVGPWQLAEAHSPLISGVPEYVGAILDGAHLQGHLDISRMHLGTGELSLREVRIARNLRAAHARIDAINLSRADIRGTADFSSIQLSNYSSPIQAKESSSRKVKVGKLFAFPFKGRAMKAGEDVNLTGATIDGGIYLREAHIQGNFLVGGIEMKKEHEKRAKWECFPIPYETARYIMDFPEEAIQNQIMGYNVKLVIDNSEETSEYEIVDYPEAGDAIHCREDFEEELFLDSDEREYLTLFDALVKYLPSSPLSEAFSAKSARKLVRNLLSRRISNEVVQVWDVYLKRVEVGGRLVMKGWEGVESVNLSEARIATLEDTEEAWPSAGRLNLAGLQVHTFADTAPNSPKDRLEWIRRQYPYVPPISPLEIFIGSIGVWPILLPIVYYSFIGFHFIFSDFSQWSVFLSLGVLIGLLLYLLGPFFSLILTSFKFYEKLRYMASSLKAYMYVGPPTTLSLGIIVSFYYLYLAFTDAGFIPPLSSTEKTPNITLVILIYIICFIWFSSIAYYIFGPFIDFNAKPPERYSSRDFSLFGIIWYTLVRWSFLEIPSLGLIISFHTGVYRISQTGSFPEWLWIIVGIFHFIVISYIAREYLRKGFIKKILEPLTVRFPFHKVPMIYWDYYFLLLASAVPYGFLRTYYQTPPTSDKGLNFFLYLLGYFVVLWPLVIAGMRYLEHRILRLWYQQKGWRYFTPYMPQMYDMVARFYQQRGQRADAIAMQIAREDDALFYGDVTGIQDVWRALLRYTTGYGYRLNLTLVLAVLFLLAGTLTFRIAYQKGAIVPASVDVLINKPYVDSHVPPSDYPKFDPFMYAFDVFIPIIDLKMEPYYLPKRGAFWGDVAWVVMWIEIIGGWLLSTLFISAVANVIRGEG